MLETQEKEFSEKNFSCVLENIVCWIFFAEKKMNSKNTTGNFEKLLNDT